ncbi:hypothetical protein ACEQPO_19810 [Bacillus sp. SL00103]
MFALRLEALRLHPEGFAMSYEEEQIGTIEKYGPFCFCSIYVDFWRF